MTKKEAEKTYVAAMKSAQLQLDRIQEGMRQHQIKQVDHESNWSFVGDALHVAKQLKEIADFLR